MSWTEERIDQLKRLWGQGMTASQIADDLGGVSRNAVIGKAHRLGLEARPSPVKGGDAAAASGSSPAAAAPAPERSPPPPRPAPAPAAVSPPPAAAAAAAPVAAPTTPQPIVRSIGPGGFQRQTPGEQSSPIPPAPPRRLVPAKPSADMADKTSLLELNDKVCKWPLGHPGEPDFHFCGEPINPGFPYCLGHCSVAYQAQLPRRDRRPPPPLPFGGPRVR
ncbi:MULTISPECIES: GcrA family cell cycle regulator [unclassified Sphingomonas]|uniref:GcrA family cell cycle regulator n=1 Tax=unclassified Sphingomonas TaxID=196159 RepID=UPI0006F9534F|nr:MULTISPECIES: GcrA family cell cycle regulator [unclassified Sphingomonas]KQX19062.1 GcrA cell cycle regulator [Sphingomonas sp. Root1294]KQY65263.1 GcrA cell cycle regulator [Sphingomonas sp. Root50]KRB95443.1 GcrA cell cycle regulator [Sphingomonas sp. Root720]